MAGGAVARREASGAGVQLQRDAGHAAEQRVVQFAGDAGALGEHGLEPPPGCAPRPGARGGAATRPRQGPGSLRA